jgi:two-component system NtrC family response regulator
VARVLIADDEAPIREMIQIACEMDGHDVRTVAGADEALAVYPGFRPELLILDLNMPGGGGERVMEQVRIQDPGCPAIFVTGLGSVLDEDERAQLGATEVLSKPFSIESLRIAVKSALGDRRP